MDEKYSVLAVSDIDTFITNYKAVYQSMTAKHDCKSKIFPKKVKVSLDDILDLNYRVTEKLKNYHDAGFSVSVTANFIGRQMLEFSSWREFENHNWSESDAINSVTIIWEFNAILPQYGVPQKHVLVVKITDGLRPEEVLNVVFAGKLENIEEIGNQMYPIVARVDFINHVLGDELLNIVTEWNKGLEAYEDDEYMFPIFFVKNRRKIAYMLHYITDIVALLCGINILNSTVKGYNVGILANLTIDNICEILWLVGILGLIFVFLNQVSQWLSNIIFNILGEERETHIFNINKGDNNLQKKLQRKYSKNFSRLIWSGLGSIILDIACAVVSSFLT